MITFLRAQRTRILWVVILLVLVLLGLTAWYKSIYSDPRRVFNSMVENSLRTSSVTKRVVQNSEDQSLDQTVRLRLGEKHLAQGMTQLSQKGLASASVVTESIGTPTSDYVRYRSIETDQKSESGEDLDFSCIVGTWGKSENTESTSGELYNELVLGVIPVGNLSESDRKEFMQKMAELDVYKVEYENVERGTVNGRQAYEYSVKVLPEAYVTLLKMYAQMVGLTHLDGVNPANYSQADAIEFKVSVDVLSRRLMGIEYESGRQEYYSAYGSEATTDLPTETVTIEELQNRLQEVGTTPTNPECD